MFLRNLKIDVLNKKRILITAAMIFGFGNAVLAQNGQVTIAQDSVIPYLLDLKTKMGEDNRLGDRYKIQIYSGDNNQASETIREYRSLFSTWPSTVEYETPNYKVWIGNFRNSLEADRALLKIREEFPAAFRFRPGRN